MKLFILFSTCYIIGSMPFGFLIGKLKGIDIRQHGSKNIGATNVARVIGFKYALLAFILDGFKGAFCLIAFSRGSFHYAIFAAFASILGHQFSAFLNFKGGKGVSTFFITTCLLSFWCGIVFAGTWIAVFMLFRYSSLASLIATLSTFIYSFKIEQQSVSLRVKEFDIPLLSLYFFVCLIIIIIKHRTNLQRLLKGTENKFSSKKIKNKTK